jgi:preprotein translocase subunit YajC
MSTLITLLAQAAPAAAPAWKVYGFFFGMMGVFYLILFLPRQREVKRHRTMVEGLQKGDTVVMAGGIIGEVQVIREGQLTIRSGGSTLLVDRARVARKLSGKGEGK